MVVELYIDVYRVLLCMLSLKYEKLTFFSSFCLLVFETDIRSHSFENPKCIVQTTSWSQCSKTCGTGVSTRVTNDNPGCRLVKETRICEVRPCGQPSYDSLKVNGLPYIHPVLVSFLSWVGLCVF